MTRSARLRWLLEELELPCEIVTVDFAPPEKGYYLARLEARLAFQRAASS